MRDKSLGGPGKGHKKKKFLAALAITAGLALMLYPWVSNQLYENAVESTVSAYDATMGSSLSGDMEMYWQAAEAYNERLLQADVVLTDPFTYRSSVAAGMESSYESVLDVDGSGIMCFVEIPKIDVYLPVYHGTSSEVLAKGAGHVEGTALPVGTAGGRPVISAHTGVNTAKLFSDLTLMEDGDLFFIHVLDETMAYRVMDIQVIKPNDVSSVQPVAGEDLVTLMTCTPYGVNSHRLLVTGERTEYTEEVQEEAGSQHPGATSEWMKAYRQVLLISAALLTGIAIAARRARRRQQG